MSVSEATAFNLVLLVVLALMFVGTVISQWAGLGLMIGSTIVIGLNIVTQ